MTLHGATLSNGAGGRQSSRRDRSREEEGTCRRRCRQGHGGYRAGSAAHEQHRACGSCNGCRCVSRPACAQCGEFGSSVRRPDSGDPTSPAGHGSGQCRCHDECRATLAPCAPGNRGRHQCGRSSGTRGLSTERRSGWRGAGHRALRRPTPAVRDRDRTGVRDVGGGRAAADDGACRRPGIAGRARHRGRVGRIVVGVYASGYPAQDRPTRALA